MSIERVIDRPVPHGLELVEGIEKWNEFLESADAFVSHRSMGRFPLHADSKDKRSTLGNDRQVRGLGDDCCIGSVSSQDRGQRARSAVFLEITLSTCIVPQGIKPSSLRTETASKFVASPAFMSRAPRPTMVRPTSVAS